MVTAFAGVFAVYDAFFAPLYVHAVRLPLALLLAVLVNPLLAWVAYYVTGRRGAGIFPAIVWCLVWFLAVKPTTEGDLIITGTNWVGLMTLLAGPVAFAVPIYRIIVAPGRRPSDTPAAGSGAPPRA